MKLYKNFTRTFIFVVIIILLVGAFSFPTTALAIDNYDFSNFTEADALAFVENHNIDVPAKLSQSEKAGLFTLNIILQSYYDPNIEFCYNYNETQRYAENIRDAVALYVNSSAVPATASTAAYQLQYNKVRDANGNWVTSGGYYDTKWLNYNCYAYSINRAEQPSFYTTGKQYQPGDMSGAGNFDYCDTIDELAAVVRADLEAMGYTNISLSETIPTIDSSHQLICVRMSYEDYHFMYYDIETNAWYHKPGKAAVLKYNLVPSNSNLWYRESSYYGIESLSPTPYDSGIIFIKYSKNKINMNTTNVTSREYIQANKDVFCELNFANAGTYEIALSSAKAIDYEIYDEDLDVIRYGTGAFHDISISIDAGTYYLRMNFESYANSSYVDISIHAHSYTYRWLSETRHEKTCSCGETSTAAHVVPQGAFPTPGGYAICLQCRGKVFMGVHYNLSINDLHHSANGSYILPNGVVVLVEEDIEAYMNGTLVFYTGEIE